MDGYQIIIHFDSLADLKHYHLHGVWLFDIMLVTQFFVYLPDRIFELQFDECHCHKVKSKYFDAVLDVVG